MTFTPNEQKSVKKLKKWLEAPMNDELQSEQGSWEKRFMRIHEHVLKFVCIELQCPKLPPANIHKNKMTKIDWVKMLCDWVSILSKL
jgi:hypothetical protein